MQIESLPDAVAAAMKPLFDHLPLDRAMEQLVVTRGASEELLDIAGKVVKEPAIANVPALASGVWLYVDELDRSHTISQSIDDATGSFWHGIMHRREGDFSNSHYWFRKTGHHPAMDEITGYDGHAFVDAVEQAHRTGKDVDDMIAMQRAEFAALFAWCANR